MKLVHIVDSDKNMWIDVNVFFQQSEMELTQWRSQISERYKRDKTNPHFTCAWCQSPVILARRTDRIQNDHSSTFYFRHIPELENNPSFQCPVKHIKQLTDQEKKALKYQAAKETQQHKTLKENIYNSLQRDDSFSDVHIEKVRKSINLKDWRRPDVSALYNKQLVVFEGQLSTTFLNIIIDRKIFYEDNDGCLLWIFDHFEPTQKAIKQSMQDIYYNNNANAFVVNNFTVAESIRQKTFILECHYLKPEIENAKIVYKWHKAFVKFKELIRNETTKQIYFFDFENEYRRLKKVLGLHKTYVVEDKNPIGKLVVQHYHEMLDNNTNERPRDGLEVYNDFLALWKNAYYLTEMQFNLQWWPLRKELFYMGIPTPKLILHAPYKTVLNSILSAKYGFVIGNQLKDIVSVAHNLMEHHPEFIKHFLLTLKVTGKPDLIIERDTSGKWNKRYEAYKKLSENKKLYNHELNEFIEFLVPEFEGRLIKWGNQQLNIENDKNYEDIK